MKKFILTALLITSFSYGSITADPLALLKRETWRFSGEEIEACLLLQPRLSISLLSYAICLERWESGRCVSGS